MENIDSEKRKKKLVKKPANVEYTKSFFDGQKLMKESLEKSEPKNDVVQDKVQGISIEKSNQTAKPKTFVRSVFSSGNKYTGTTIIRGENGSKVFEGRTDMKATQDALKASEKKVKDTNADRDKNADNYNANSGSKKELSDKNIKDLSATRKIVVR